MTVILDDELGVRPHEGNPFPGLRPFEAHESSLFFGRDEQCDDLLMRLGRRRLVAAVGMSGSGKSSLVRAGLLPALDRGYLPSAGSSWHIAVFRPGSDPVSNLTRALATRRLPGGAAADDDPEAIGRLLDASSLGLVDVARQLLQESGDSLLVVADQFEEIFRFGRIGSTRDTVGRAAASVDLLLNATLQQDVPVYVVLTMRSDYLGDCAQFTGLPEALNDSQFLVPRMTRAQLRAAIECPVAVGGAQITPRLVQRLLHEIDETTTPEEPRGGRQDQDQLPVLQHTLMRMWDVSREARERGEPIDLHHYEQPPVETLRHALDRHAEEVYQQLPTDYHRAVARRVFQQLTDRDAENREVRRPTPLSELTAVAVESTSAAPGVVDDVIAAFSAPGRAFVMVNAQQDVDISHESFIRKWVRLRGWVEEEARSRRVYVKLAAAASSWEHGEASLYRGPELAEARRWWEQQSPTSTWANRYDARFEIARRFLARSVLGQRLRRGLVMGNVVLLVVGAIAIAVLMAYSRSQALEVRNAVEEMNRRAEEANRFLREALTRQREGNSAEADALVRKAQEVQQESAPVLTRSELTELNRLRQAEAAWQRTEADLRGQLARAAAVPAADPYAADRADLDRLRRAEAAWERESAQLRQELAATNERMARLQQAETSTRRINEELQARLSDARDTTRASEPRNTGPADTAAIEQLLREYEAAYDARDPAAIVRLVPSTKASDLTRTFSQVRSYRMQILDPQISVNGDTAQVVCTRRMTIVPRVGSGPPPAVIPTLFRLKRAAGAWTIESVDERAAGGESR